VTYARYVSILKWLCLSLFSYVACALIVQVPWGAVAQAVVLPEISAKPEYIMAIVAVLGTTISPYLFFWQAEEEVEDERESREARPLLRAPEQASSAFHRIRLDTWIGMGISNLIAFFIIVTTGTTLNTHGITDIETSAQAAEALRAVTGKFTFLVFAAGIIGTGMLTVPVLAGSAAYAVGEALAWRVGLARLPGRAKKFYATIAVATLIGVAINFSPVNPIKALFWSAVINGVAAVPIMVMMMIMTARRDVMGAFTLPRSLKIMGWVATAAMSLAAVGMVASWF
jgi:Mn2+/Fe2+ NRAMP family transporter